MELLSVRMFGRYRDQPNAGQRFEQARAAYEEQLGWRERRAKTMADARAKGNVGNPMIFCKTKRIGNSALRSARPTENMYIS